MGIPLIFVWIHLTLLRLPLAFPHISVAEQEGTHLMPLCTRLFPSDYRPQQSKSEICAQQSASASLKSCNQNQFNSMQFHGRLPKQQRVNARTHSSIHPSTKLCLSSAEPKRVCGSDGAVHYSGDLDRLSTPRFLLTRGRESECLLFTVCESREADRRCHGQQANNNRFTTFVWPITSCGRWMRFGRSSCSDKQALPSHHVPASRDYHSEHVCFIHVQLCVCGWFTGPRQNPPPHTPTPPHTHNPTKHFLGGPTDTGGLSLSPSFFSKVCILVRVWPHVCVCVFVHWTETQISTWKVCIPVLPLLPALWQETGAGGGVRFPRDSILRRAAEM